jgi:hypothetical protein
MSCENCKSGFSWNGTPTGTETTIGKNKTYKTGTSKSAAILIVHDIFGWTFPNLRLLADHFAKEADATVYLADLYAQPFLILASHLTNFHNQLRR